ncbi:MAG: hypothetical protein AABX33_07175 [Nanoarchaeota archaeon]|mgnify:CR=1 FL=1
MPTKLITKFDSLKEWKNYCFDTHSLYLTNQHFKKWIIRKEIVILNLSSLRNQTIQHIKQGVENAIKLGKLHFKIYDNSGDNYYKVINIKDENIRSDKLLKMVVKIRKKSHKEQANIFILNKPINSPNGIIKDGEALTYVSEGVIMFTFDTHKKYPYKFLMRRAKHETLHLLGLNFHHEDTKIEGYDNSILCNMNYNAPTQYLCKKCRDALLSFWKGIEYATKQKLIKG